MLPVLNVNAPLLVQDWDI